MIDEAIDKVMTLLSLDEDEYLKVSTLAELVEAEILEYTRLETIASISQSLFVKMLMYKYQKLGNEAIQSQSYEGVSESYQASYPDDIITSLNFYRKKLRCF